MDTSKSEAPFLEVCYPSRRSVLTSSSARGAKLVLFVPTRQRVEAGAPIRLLLSMRDTHRLFELFGTAMSDSSGPREPRMSGFQMCFTGADKKRAAEMLAFCADRPPAMGTAGSRRFPVRVQCRIRSGVEKGRAQLLDLSRTGAFVTMTDPQQLGTVTQLELLLRPRLLGLFGHWVRGEVVWRGRKEGCFGVGVRFVDNTTEVGHVLEDLASRRPTR